MILPDTLHNAGSRGVRTTLEDVESRQRTESLGGRKRRERWHGRHFLFVFAFFVAKRGELLSDGLQRVSVSERRTDPDTHLGEILHASVEVFLGFCRDALGFATAILVQIRLALPERFVALPRVRGFESFLEQGVEVHGRVDNRRPRRLVVHTPGDLGIVEKLVRHPSSLGVGEGPVLAHDDDTRGSEGTRKNRRLGRTWLQDKGQARAAISSVRLTWTTITPKSESYVKLIISAMG